MLIDVSWKHWWRLLCVCRSISSVNSWYSARWPDFTLGFSLRASAWLQRRWSIVSINHRNCLQTIGSVQVTFFNPDFSSRDESRWLMSFKLLRLPCIIENRPNHRHTERIIVRRLRHSQVDSEKSSLVRESRISECAMHCRCFFLCRAWTIRLHGTAISLADFLLFSPMRSTSRYAPCLLRFVTILTFSKFWWKIYSSLEKSFFTVRTDESSLFFVFLLIIFSCRLLDHCANKQKSWMVNGSIGATRQIRCSR